MLMIMMIIITMMIIAQRKHGVPILQRFHFRFGVHRLNTDNKINITEPRSVKKGTQCIFEKKLSTMSDGAECSG